MSHNPEEQRTTLRRVLRRADYATSEMEAAEGHSHQAETLIIRRIEAATITTNNYPVSRRQKLSSDSAALATWENEGGSVRASKQKTERNDNLTERNGDAPHLPQ